MTDGPKKISTEPTLAIDRSKLPPRDRAAIDLARESYPNLPPDEDVSITEASPEELAEMLRAERQRQPTLEHCVICERCRGCSGEHMVTHERNQELLGTKA